MQIVLKDMIGKKCIVYIDDILIFGKDKTVHNENVAQVENKLAEFGLQENFDKRKFKMNEIKFLGYLIEENKIRPSKERSQAIIDYKVPSSKKELQKFFGMVNYDRINLKEITKLGAPLYRLLSKEAKFEWTEKDTEVFDRLKDQWKKNLELITPDCNRRFELETDACDIGIGAVLRQEHGPIAYASRALKKTECNYAITEKELLAAKWAMNKFMYYLKGREFDLITDHQAIKQVKKKLDFGNAKIKRWFMESEEYDFVVKYKQGRHLVVADALSRSVNQENNSNSKEYSTEEIYNIVTKIHKGNCHRKNIVEILQEKNVRVTKGEVEKILASCKTCVEKI